MPVVLFLTLARTGSAPFDLAIVRDLISRPEVSARTLAAGTVGYIRLAGFSDRAARDFGAAVAFLCAQQAGYITGAHLLVDGGAYSGLL